jgi:hypothetical protein
LITCPALSQITPILKTSPKYCTQECKISKVEINDTNYYLTKINGIIRRFVISIFAKSIIIILCCDCCYKQITHDYLMILACHNNR